MAPDLPTSLPGDKLRKAVQRYAELKQQSPESSHFELLELVAREFDLSPLESDFLNRNLRSDD